MVPPRPADSFVHEVMSINDLVAFATGVRFAIDAIEMIVVDAKLAARLGIANGEEWLSVRGFRPPKGTNFPSAGPKFTSTGNLPPSAASCSVTPAPFSI